MLATSFASSLLEAPFEALPRSGSFGYTFNIAGVLDNDIIIVHNDIWLATSIVSILVVVIVVVTNQPRIRLNGIGAEVYRRVWHTKSVGADVAVDVDRGWEMWKTRVTS